MEASKFRVAAQVVAILEIAGAVVSGSFHVSEIVAVYLLAALFLSIALLRSAIKADEDPACANKWVVAWLLFQWISLCIMLMIGTVWIVAVLVSDPSYRPLPAQIPPFLLMGLVVLFRTPGLYFVHKYRSELCGTQQVTRQV